MTTENEFPWDDVDQLDGLDLIDKSELVGKPFLITGVYFTENDRAISFIYVDGERTDGTTFTFHDSSTTGVRFELITYLTERGKPTDSLGELIPMRVIIPRGLRFSEYSVKNERGQEKQAKTFYLTRSGKRAQTPPTGATAEAAPKARRGRPASAG